MIAYFRWSVQDGISAKKTLPLGNFHDIGIALSIVPHGDHSENIRKLELDNSAKPPPFEFSAGRKARDGEPSHLEVTVPGDELIDQRTIAANGRGAFPAAPGAVHIQRFGESDYISAKRTFHS